MIAIEIPQRDTKTAKNKKTQVNLNLSSKSSISQSSTSSLSIIENSVKDLPKKEKRSTMQKNKLRMRKTSLEIEADEVAYRNESLLNEVAFLYKTLDTLKPTSYTSLNFHSEIYKENLEKEKFFEL